MKCGVYNCKKPKKKRLLSFVECLRLRDNAPSLFFSAVCDFFLSVAVAPLNASKTARTPPPARPALWPAVVGLYRGMAGLPDEEKSALRPFSPAEERILLTGLHAVADIYCDCCKTTLG